MSAAQMRPIEVFRPGTFNPMEGGPFTCSAADLAAMAANYDPVNHPAPVVVGHPRHDAPAYGWVDRLFVEGGVLKAQLKDTPAEFVDMVKAGRYRKISICLFKPDTPSNPKPGAIYLKHVGFLGAAAPAVPGLKPVEFADDDGALEFAYTPASRRLDDLRDKAKAARDGTREVAVDRLIDAGSLPRNRRAEVLAFVESIDGGEQFSFAEGRSRETQADWFFRFMREQPAGLFDPERDYRPMEVYGRPEEDGRSFAAGDAEAKAADGVSIPHGFAVDPGSDQLLRRARQIERDQGVSFAEAVDRAVAEAGK